VGCGIDFGSQIGFSTGDNPDASFNGDVKVFGFKFSGSISFKGWLPVGASAGLGRGLCAPVSLTATLPPVKGNDQNGDTSRIAGSQDPNEKLGPSGFSTPNFVQADKFLPYRIDFENAMTATAPAQAVTITDQLAPTLDWSTFRLTEIGFGDILLTVPANSQHYQTTVAMTYNGKTFNVLIEAGLHSDTGQVFATFQSLDPNTQLPPDVFTGFLPPEDGTGLGMGHLSYTIRPKANLPTGTQIRNVARIIFDQNPPIDTDQVSETDPSQGKDPSKQALVTIDAVPPASSVAALPAQEPTPSFTVSWSGTDDANGSGVASYTVYVSDNSGAFTPWLTDTKQTSATYVGTEGHTYSFYSVAVDNAGNRQATPATAQATTKVNAVPATIASITLTTPNGTYSIGAAINVTVTFSKPVTLAGGNLTINLNDGGVVTIAPFTNATTASGTYTVALGQFTIALDSTSMTLTPGASFQDANGQSVSLTIPAGHSLANTSALAINAAPPVISPISPHTVADGTTLSFTITATAQSLNGSPVPLSFSLGTGGPAGAGLNAQTGLFTWTPSQWNGQAPSVYSFSVSVTETNAPQLVGRATFSVTVGPTSTNPGSGQPARQTVANSLTQSAEYYSNFITAAYNKYLGRSSDAFGLAYWVQRMQYGLTDEQLEAGFIGSDEYIQNHGGAGPSWIQSLYVTLLGRTPAPNEVQYWVDQLHHGVPPTQIALGFTTSQEREAQRVAADYQQYLGRGASSSEIQYWVNFFLNGGNNEQVIGGFISSQEYFQQHGNDIVDWLFAAYRAILQRELDPFGYQYWLSQL
jgi:hypothetical protein